MAEIITTEFFTKLFAKKILNFGLDKIFKKLGRNPRFFELKKELGIAKLTPDFDSIYLHALVQFVLDARTDIAPYLFGLEKVRETFHALIYEGKPLSAVADEMATQLEIVKVENKEDRWTEWEIENLSMEDLMAEAETFAQCFHFFKITSSDPLQYENHRILSRLEEEADRAKEERDRRSFNSQVRVYLEILRKHFNRYFPGNTYIDVQGETWVSLEDSAPPPKTSILSERVEKAKPVLYNPLDELIDQWLGEERHNLLIIIGKYGTGKTAFCRHIATKLAEAFLDGEKARIPFYVPLKECKDSFKEFISTQFRDAGISDINYTGLLTRMENKEIILILDGFDEMGTGIDTGEMQENFESIREIVNWPGSKILLTIRKEYFESSATIQNIFEGEGFAAYRFADMLKFGPGQIKAFLKEHTDKDKLKYYLDLIDNNLRLNELAEIPVHLKAITEYWPELLKKLEGKSISSIKESQLIKMCIDGELRRTASKKRFKIPKEYRRQILCDISVEMVKSDTLSFDIEYLEKKAHLRKHFKTIHPWEYQPYLHEFLTYTLLQPIGESRYQFTLKVFRDCMASEVFAREINRNQLKHFPMARIPGDVSKFIHEQLKPEQLITTKRLLKMVKASRDLPRGKKWQGTNATTLLLRSKPDVFQGQDLSKCQMPRVDFKRCVLSGTDFSGADLSHCSFTETILKANLENAILKDTSLKIGYGKIRDIEAITSRKELTQLSRLILAGNKLNNIELIREFKKLVELNLSSTGLTYIGPLKTLKNLRKLDLNNNRIEDIGPLKGLKKLKELNLYGNPITDLTPLIELERLEYLWIKIKDKEIEIIPAEQVKALQKALPGCMINPPMTT